jgi:antitoxin (DNA-binding transcriptional repressor) of toxin-antitoxin stability system
MKTVTLDEFEGRLSEHLVHLKDGEELTITVNGAPYAKLTKLARTSWPSKAGTAGCYRKEGFWMAPDFDAPLEDFKEYTE